MEQAINEIAALQPESVRTCVFLDKAQKGAMGFTRTG